MTPQTSDSSCVLLRQLRPADYDAVDALLADTWRQAYAHQMSDWKMRLLLTIARPGWKLARGGDFDPRTLVAEQDGSIKGMLMYGRAVYAKRVMIWMLYVHPSSQSRGIGSVLLERALELTVGSWGAERGHRLYVLDGNDRAVAFYGRHGFTFVRRKWDPWTFSRVIVMDRPATGRG